MNIDEFEDLLRRQPMNGPPAHWRREILAAAARSSRPAATWASGLPLWSLLRNWLWPHPVAWGALAACWLAIAALNHAAAPSPAEFSSARAGAAIAGMGFTMLRNMSELGLTQEPASFPSPPRQKRDTPESGWCPPSANSNSRPA